MIDPFQAELLACFTVIQEAAKMGIPSLCIETDASLVKIEIETDDYQLSAVGGIITKMKLFLRSEFSSFSLNQTLSVCNRVCNLPSDHCNTWDSVPHEIEDLVTSDLAGSDE